MPKADAHARPTLARPTLARPTLARPTHARPTRRPGRLGALAAPALLAVLLAGGVLAESCTAIAGTTDGSMATPDRCPLGSPLCAPSVIRGDLEGTFDLVFTSFASPTPAAAHPARFTFMGTFAMVLEHGTLAGHLYGFADAVPGAPWPFEGTLVLEGGTGAYAGARGHLVQDGHFDVAANTAPATVRGALCA